MFDKILYYKMLLNNYLLLGTKIVDILNKYDETALKLTIPKGEIVAAVKQLEDSLKIVHTGKYTQDLAKADEVRDNAWYCFYFAIISASYNHNAELRDAAEELMPLVKNKNMNIGNMGYQKESASLKKFFNKIDSKNEYVNAITTLKITDLYQALKDAQNAFEVVELKKIDDEADKPKSESIEACKQLRAAITNLDKFIEVSSQMEPNTQYDSMSSEINEIIAENNTLVSARATRRKNAKDQNQEEEAQS